MQQPVILVADAYVPANIRPGLAAVLFVPGIASTRASLDRSWGEDASFPRTLAASGRAVYVLDRLGMGDSAYIGSGRNGASIGAEAQVAGVDAVMAGLRSGGYLQGTGTCADDLPNGASWERVVIGGQSYGGWLTMAHATRDSDLAAAFVLTSHNQGTNPLGTSYAASCASAHADANGYTAFFCTDTGHPLRCEDALVWPEGAGDEVAGQVCEGATATRAPMGQIDAADLWARTLARLDEVPPIPVLFEYGDHDRLLNDGPDGSDRTRIDRELAMWRDRCPCTVTDHLLPSTGHYLFAHDSRAEMTTVLLDWLDENGL